MGENKTIAWAGLLRDAVNKPGVISSAYSVFHDYSMGNQLLAWSQCAARGVDLAPLATYKHWQSLGRQVKRGAKAIQLCMPILFDKKDKDTGEKTNEKMQLFVLKRNWFLLSDTEGTDYVKEQKTPAWDSVKALAALGITQVPFTHANGNCQGYAQGDTIAINPVAALPHKTRFHELAHVVLGHTKEHTLLADDEKTPRDTREVEAESVAYILCSVLGLDGLHESRGYIQGWLQGNDITDKSAQKIFGAADKILKAGA